MNAKPISVLHDIESNNDLVVGKKYNGFSEVLVIRGGQVHLLNKSGTDHTDNAPHITSITVPDNIDAVVVGEGYAPSGRVEDAKSIFGSYPDHALDVQGHKGLAIFAAVSIIRYDGSDLRKTPFGERLPVLSDLITYLQHLGAVNVHQETLIKTDKEKYFNHIISSGGEGVVVKSLSGLESDWFKVKKTSTWDVVITGFTEAQYGLTGKFAGLIGAIKYGVYDSNNVLKEIGKCSGMSDTQRMEFSVNREFYIGEVIEIRGQEIGNRGAVVFPRFVRIRSDKLPIECGELI